MAKVKALLKDNPDLVFSKDKAGLTRLHVVALDGRKDVVELLLANNAEVNTKDDERQGASRTGRDPSSFKPAAASLEHG